MYSYDLEYQTSYLWWHISPYELEILTFTLTWIALENCGEWDFDEVEQNVGGHPDTKFIIYTGYMEDKQNDWCTDTFII